MKEGKATYGQKEVKKAVEQGAVEILMLTDNFITKKREENTFSKVEEIMKNTEKISGKVKIISSEHEGGQKLDGLGGMAAILRYKIDY